RFDDDRETCSARERPLGLFAFATGYGVVVHWRCDANARPVRLDLPRDAANRSRRRRGNFWLIVPTRGCGGGRYQDEVRDVNPHCIVVLPRVMGEEDRAHPRCCCFIYDFDSTHRPKCAVHSPLTMLLVRCRRYRLVTT